jgi:hypothetical protein
LKEEKKPAIELEIREEYLEIREEAEKKNRTAEPKTAEPLSLHIFYDFIRRSQFLDRA